MTLAVEPPHPRLGSWNTPLQLSGKPGASSVHDPSQGPVQEPDLPADHDRAPRDPLAVTTGVEVLGLLPGTRPPSWPRTPAPGRRTAGASSGQQPVATRMSPELSSTTRNVPSARMARPWAALTPVTRVLTVPDDRVTALIVPPPMSATY